MTTPRSRRWMSIRGIAGGMAMFVTEALIVAGLVVVAWIFSVVVLALL